MNHTSVSAKSCGLFGPASPMLPKKELYTAICWHCDLFELISVAPLVWPHRTICDVEQMAP